MTAIIHHPKGSMCANCANQLDNCSHLAFSTMPVTKKYSHPDGTTIFNVVVCREFKKEETQ